MDKLCVILGAGASHDVGGAGSPIINPDFIPPLAIDLFNLKEHQSYWEVINAYNGAVYLGQELAEKSLTKTIDIERELKHYANHKDGVIREHFKHIPAYLRDLLSRASSRYTYVPSSYIRLVQKLLAEYPHDVLFLVLNYDNLLEKALERHNTNMFRFNEIHQYIDDNRKAKVVKLHGSINWFRFLPASPGDDWDSAIANFDIFKKLPENEIIIREGMTQVKGTRYDNKLLYPILTAPLAGKGLTDAVCPESHLTAAKKFISGCVKFLIIGTSGLDKDLLEMLDTTIAPMQAVLVNIVDKSDGAGLARERFEKGVRAFESLDIYSRGFYSYLASEQFIGFLKFQT